MGEAEDAMEEEADAIVEEEEDDTWFGMERRSFLSNNEADKGAAPNANLGDTTRKKQRKKIQCWSRSADIFSHLIRQIVLSLMLNDVALRREDEIFSILM